MSGVAPPRTLLRDNGGMAATLHVPLAERLRPRSLDDVIGQTHLLGPGMPLRLAFESGRPHSCILWGPPGSGKTTLARALAHGVAGTFQRIQFTSDLLPSDVIGLSAYNERLGDFEFKPGPVFANIVLAADMDANTNVTLGKNIRIMRTNNNNK